MKISQPTPHSPCNHLCVCIVCWLDGWWLKLPRSTVHCVQSVEQHQSTGLSNTSVVVCLSVEPQKRRRFNALKNLRRIFRRRTVASAETLPSKGKIRSHLAPVELEDSHFRDSFNAFKQPSLVSIRSTTTATGHEDGREQYEQGRHRSTTLDYGQGVGGSISNNIGNSRHHRSGPGPSRTATTRHAEDYSFDDCRTRRDHRHHAHKLSVNPLDRLSVQQVHVNDGSTLLSSSGTDWTNGAHKRSHSEDRLKEG